MMAAWIRQYRVVRKLGAGGMGEVFLCEDTHLQRQVAVKVLAGDFVADSKRKHRFLREARAAAQLTHPNVCVVFEAAETEDGLPFIAMEYVNGPSLRERMTANGRVPISEAVDIALAIAEALEAAHERQILHRDIKPANVMLSGRGLVKVVDFGLAKFVGEDVGDRSETDQMLTDAGQFVGTAAYVSPEQAQGRDLDHRSDIFSFGVLLYELLADHLPFRGDSKVEMLHRIISEPPEALSRARNDVPAELERIVNKCLQKDPARRYQSAREIAVDLRNLEFTLAAPSHTGTRVRRSLLWRPIVIASIALVVVAAAILALQYSRSTKPVLDSVAVMPFANETGDAGLDYLSDGLTETITNGLSQRPNLRVVPRSTLSYYRKKNLSPQEMAVHLHVAAFVTGRIGRAGDQLDVQAELVDVAAEAQRWGERFKIDRGDMLTVEEQMSRDVLSVLGAGTAHPVNEGGTNDREAFDLYLRGRYAANRRTPQSIAASIPLLEHAIERDPHYALAYAQLVEAYLLGLDYVSWHWADIRPKVASALERSRLLAARVPQVRIAAALFDTWTWKFSDAETELRRAIADDPTQSLAWFRLGLLLDGFGRNQEALEALQKAQELDPLASVIRANIVRHYLNAGDVNHASEGAHELISLDPTFPPSHEFLGAVDALTGARQAALAELRLAVETSQSAPRPLAKLGYTEAVVGNRQEAQRIAKTLEDRHAKSGIPLTHAAMVYAGLGDRDRAFACLEQDYRDRQPLTWSVTVAWEFQPLRGDKRYDDLARRLGLR